MGAGPYEVDDLDFVVRAVLSSDGKVSAEPGHIWMALRTRIEDERRGVRRRLALGTLSYLAPREWTLDWHLMSLARVVC